MPNVADLISRANAIRERARTLEAVPGSGLHDTDRNPTRPEMFAAPQKNGLPRQSEHLVFFLDLAGEEMLFAGPDADRALTALKAWEVRTKRQDPLTLTGTERKLLARVLPRLAPAADGTLRVRADSWNDVLHALYAEGLGVSGAPLDE